LNEGARAGHRFTPGTTIRKYASRGARNAGRLTSNVQQDFSDVPA
jgi:hypothetical protein